jgi:pyruvate kinase
MRSDLHSLIGELSHVHARMTQVETQCGRHLERIHPDQRASAANLLHYLTLRRHDLRSA